MRRRLMLRACSTSLLLVLLVVQLLSALPAFAAIGQDDSGQIVGGPSSSVTLSNWQSNRVFSTGSDLPATVTVYNTAASDGVSYVHWNLYCGGTSWTGGDLAPSTSQVYTLTSSLNSCTLMVKGYAELN